MEEKSCVIKNCGQVSVDALDRPPINMSINTQSTSQSTFGQHSIDTFFYFNICSKSKKSSSRELMLFTMYITCDDQTKHTQRNRS